MMRKAHWDNEENEEIGMELSEEASETEVSHEEESEDEGPLIKDVLEKPFPENALLNCYLTECRLPKIVCYGLPADNYFEINA